MNTSESIYKHYADKNGAEKPRHYLGWSSIGDVCDRTLWLSFRNATTDNVTGRIARLFQTGHREEDRVLDDLRNIGCKVESRDAKTGKQFAVQSHGGHFRGHADAIVTGLPEDHKTRFLVDVKTTNVKKFAALKKDGFRKTYPKYWAQGQGYMGHLGLKRAMFIFVCKDNDEIHCEFFDFDQSEFEKYESRAEKIIFSDRMPFGISEDGSWFECKFCNAHDLCHGSKLTKKVNCRTCAHSTPERDGTWSCAHWQSTIPDMDAQMAGCDNHVIHPDLTPKWEFEPTENGVIWLTPHGKITNSPDHYLSTEIVANPMACAIGIRDQYAEFEPRVVG